MSITSYLRGHPIIFKNGEFFYQNTNTPTIGNERPCGYCGKENTKNDHDGCLGTLPGVINACCGHGVVREAYIQFSQSNCLRKMKAINEINRLNNIKNA